MTTHHEGTTTMPTVDQLLADQRAHEALIAGTATPAPVVRPSRGRALWVALGAAGAVATLAAVAALAVGGGGGRPSTGGVAHSTTVARPAYAPDTAQPLDTPVGRVWIDDSAVYGPCSVLKGHDGHVKDVIGLAPPAPFADWGLVCS